MDFKYKRQTLTNGLQVVQVPMAVPTVTCLVLVNVGSRYETDRHLGISHFLEHIVFKGTRKYPTFMDVAEVLDSVGSEHNAFTSKEYTGFYVKVASDYLELALDVLSQLMFEPRLPEEDIEREKGVIVEEINMYEDTPMRKIGDVFDQLMYQGHELGRDIIGSKETVTGLSRKDFVEHMASWYRPGRMVLGIAGDSKRIKDSKHKISGLIEQYFDSGTLRLSRASHGSRDAQGDKLALKSLASLSSKNKYKNSQKKPRVKLKYKETEQAHFSLGVGSLKRGHKDRYVQLVLSTILGGNMSSRLFSEVREKRGLAYYVRSGTSQFHETGYLTAQAGVTVGKIEEAITAVLEQYHNVSEVGNISIDELKKAKEYIKGKLKIDLEDSFQVASSFTSSLLLEGKIREPKKLIEGVDKVSVEDLVRLAKKILVGDKLNLAVIGPYKKADKFQKLLKL